MASDKNRRVRGFLPIFATSLAVGFLSVAALYTARALMKKKKKKKADFQSDAKDWEHNKQQQDRQESPNMSRACTQGAMQFTYDDQLFICDDNYSKNDSDADWKKNGKEEEVEVKEIAQVPLFSMPSYFARMKADLVNNQPKSSPKIVPINDSAVSYLDGSTWAHDFACHGVQCAMDFREGKTNLKNVNCMVINESAVLRVDNSTCHKGHMNSINSEEDKTNIHDMQIVPIDKITVPYLGDADAEEDTKIREPVESSENNVDAISFQEHEIYTQNVGNVLSDERSKAYTLRDDTSCHTALADIANIQKESAKSQSMESVLINNCSITCVDSYMLSNNSTCHKATIDFQEGKPKRQNLDAVPANGGTIPHLEGFILADGSVCHDARRNTTCFQESSTKTGLSTEESSRTCCFEDPVSPNHSTLFQDSGEEDSKNHNLAKGSENNLETVNFRKCKTDPQTVANVTFHESTAPHLDGFTLMDDCKCHRGLAEITDFQKGKKNTQIVEYFPINENVVDHVDSSTLPDASVCCKACFNPQEYKMNHGNVNAMLIEEISNPHLEEEAINKITVPDLDGILHEDGEIPDLMEISEDNINTSGSKNAGSEDEGKYDYYGRACNGNVSNAMILEGLRHPVVSAKSAWHNEMADHLKQEGLQVMEVQRLMIRHAFQVHRNLLMAMAMAILHRLRDAPFPLLEMMIIAIFMGIIAIICSHYGDALS